VTAGGVWNEEVPTDGAVYPAFIDSGAVTRTSAGHDVALHFLQPTWPDAFAIDGQLNATGTALTAVLREDATGRTDTHAFSAKGVTACRYPQAAPIVCTFVAASTDYPVQGAAPNGSFTLSWDNVSDLTSGAWNEHAPANGRVFPAFVTQGLVGAEDPTAHDVSVVLAFSQPAFPDVFAFAGTLTGAGTTLSGLMDGAQFTAHGKTTCVQGGASR
jgi:hypothetical protein